MVFFEVPRCRREPMSFGDYPSSRLRVSAAAIDSANLRARVDALDWIVKKYKHAASAQGSSQTSALRREYSTKPSRAKASIHGLAALTSSLRLGAPLRFLTIGLPVSGDLSAGVSSRLFPWREAYARSVRALPDGFSPSGEAG